MVVVNRRFHMASTGNAKASGPEQTPYTLSLRKGIVLFFMMVLLHKRDVEIFAKTLTGMINLDSPDPAADELKMQNSGRRWDPLTSRS